jgi:polyisoprenoid-binding protein YceI
MHAALLLTALAVALNPDPAHTTVQFKLGATLHTVHGSFKLAHSDVRFDPASGKISGVVAIDASSGASGDDSRDRRMHQEILESAKYPEIVFTPDRVDGAVAAQGASQIQVHGVFRIHGAAHEITIPVQVQMANGQASVKTSFTIPYVKWGMKNPSTFLLRVSDKVEIEAATDALP